MISYSPFVNKAIREELGLLNESEMAEILGVNSTQLNYLYTKRILPPVARRSNNGLRKLWKKSEIEKLKEHGFKIKEEVEIGIGGHAVGEHLVRANEFYRLMTNARASR